MRAPIRLPRPDIVNRARPAAPTGQGRDWYRILNRADTTSPGLDTAEVWIYDYIGEDVVSGPFAQDLAQISAKNITVRLNSPGGSVFDGTAIYNALIQHPAKVTVYVDGVALSAGSVIAQAGDEVIMGRGTQMMIHDAAGFCYGNASDMEEMRDILDRFSGEIARVYADHAGGTVDEWRARMRKETWYTAEEAIKVGLADEMMPPPKRRKRGDDDDAAPDENDDENDGDTGEDEPDPGMLTRRHDVGGMYRYPGRDSAPAPDIPDVGRGAAPAPAGPTSQATGAAGQSVTITWTGPGTVTATGTPTAPGPGDSPDVEGDEVDDTDTPAPAEDPATADDNDADADDAADEADAADTEPGPAADTDDHATGVADDWAALTAALVTPTDHPWTALTAHLTDSTSTDDLIAALRG